MRKIRKIFEKKAQSIMEYTLLIAVVATAFMVMQVFISRVVQGKLKVIEDQINDPIVVIDPD